MTSSSTEVFVTDSETSSRRRLLNKAFTVVDDLVNSAGDGSGFSKDQVTKDSALSLKGSPIPSDAISSSAITTADGANFEQLRFQVTKTPESKPLNAFTEPLLSIGCEL